MALGKLENARARRCADELGKNAGLMDDAFRRLRNEMRMLQSAFQSPAATQLYSTYNTLEKKIDSFPSKVRDFKVFLNNAVDTYEADESAFNREVI